MALKLHFKDFEVDSSKIEKPIGGFSNENDLKGEIELVIGVMTGINRTLLIHIKKNTAQIFFIITQ